MRSSDVTSFLRSIGSAAVFNEMTSRSFMKHLKKVFQIWMNDKERPAYIKSKGELSYGGKRWEKPALLNDFDVFEITEVGGGPDPDCTVGS